ncbi:MAG: ATP-binding protein [Victivallales bacterium]|nr:ATP-binding protein [Victivallales bacterium]MCF7888694.1 ATP-binding protein [Victivallales bacterium]
MKEELKFSIKNNVEDLEEMNFTVKGFLEAYDVIDNTIFKVNLILEELVTNIIKYGFKGKAEVHDILIYLSLKKCEGQIYIRIEDTGDEFNPLYAPAPETELPLENIKVGGLGLHLVKNIISNIVYQRFDNRNIQQLWLKRD